MQHRRASRLLAVPGPTANLETGIVGVDEWGITRDDSSMKAYRWFPLMAVLCLGLSSCGENVGPFDNGDMPRSVTLVWDAPVVKADGSPLQDLMGFRIYYGTDSPVTANNSTVVTLDLVTEYTISDLEPGIYYFRVSAIDPSGSESDLSNEVSTEIIE